MQFFQQLNTFINGYSTVLLRDDDDAYWKHL